MYIFKPPTASQIPTNAPQTSIKSQFWRAVKPLGHFLDGLFCVLRQVLPRVVETASGLVFEAHRLLYHSAQDARTC